MFQLLAVLALAFAQEGSKIDELVHSNKEMAIEKVSQEAEFSEESTTITVSEKDSNEYAEDVSDKQVEKILSESRVAFEPVQSLKGVIEKETARAIQDGDKKDEDLEAIDPVTEDLVLFTKQPTVTISEPSQSQKQGSYEELAITPEEKQKIANILTTMAENNVFKLLFEKKRLERLGHEVNHVHPVRFLGTVFNDPRLVYCMHKIRSSGFKWGGFIDGFSMRFKQELDAKNVNAFVPGLAETLNVSAADIQRYIDQSDVEGLIVFLMEQSRRRS